jgi:hypothetical protein
MRALGLFVATLMLLACEDEECSPDALRCTLEGVEQCVTTQCSVVSHHSSWSLVQRCERSEMCTIDGCSSPDGGTRSFQRDPGEDCSVH